MMLSVAAAMMGADFLGKEAVIKNICIDSRKAKKGDLFFALPGENVDGHDYIHEVEKKGVAAVVVSRQIKTHLPMLLVSDTLKALGLLAKAYRRRFEIPLIAVTGSCGKTTVKEMIRTILLLQGKVLSTEGNLNTEIGVPLTLFRLDQEHSMGVIEMGARKKGDIAYLMGLVNPSVSLITNAGMAHVGVFGSEKTIAQTKGEIFERLPTSGTAVINNDDPNASYWKGLIQDQQYSVTFGMQNPSDIMAANVVIGTNGSEFDLVTHLGIERVCLSVPGKHNVLNALSAAASACALGIGIPEIVEGLQQFKAASGRLQMKSAPNNSTIIDDTYNANPASVRAALSVLAKTSGKTIAVLGDMFELGEEAEKLHRDIGEEAKCMRIDTLLATGDLSRATVEGFGEGALHFNSKEELTEALQELMDSTTTVLVKGSRGMKMEEIVNAIMERQQETTC